MFLLVQGTDYHRVIPTRDINTKSRDKFWQQTEKEEIKRKEAEMKRLQEEKERAEQERKEREVGWISYQSMRGRLDSLGLCVNHSLCADTFPLIRLMIWWVWTLFDLSG